MSYLKLIGFILFAICYLFTSIPFYIWSKFDRYKPRKYLTNLASFYAKRVLKLFGMRINLKNFKPFEVRDVGRLIISNHMSYIDALVMMAHRPVCFVTSVEMRNTPFLGQICEAGGCLYVERRSRQNLSDEIIDITNALKTGLDVVIFPEATSTNGEELRRFKRPLFQAAIDAGALIIPQTLKYQFVNDRPITTENRDSVCWYGEMKFFPHLLDVMSKKSFDFEIVMNSPFMAKSCQTTLELSELAQSQIKLSWQPILSP
jgi:1-acyl-sn-glycerol-3-phosphate acyltransferase